LKDGTREAHGVRLTPFRSGEPEAGETAKILRRASGSLFTKTKPGTGRNLFAFEGTAFLRVSTRRVTFAAADCYRAAAVCCGQPTFVDNGSESRLVSGLLFRSAWSSTGFGAWAAAVFL